MNSPTTTDKELLSILEKCGKQLSLAPGEFKTQELCDITVQSYRWELCDITVQSYRWAFKWVPDEFKTQEMCDIAVKSCGWALADVPEKFRTPELIKIREKG